VPARAQSTAEGDAARSDTVIGRNLPQPAEYADVNGVKKVIFTMVDAARIPGFPVRQHPVNAGLFDSGCAQCHRLAGPLPPGSGAPEDVFDRLQPAAEEGAVPDGFVRLTAAPGREEYPSWSPAGTTILYEARDAQGRYNLWAMDADGTNQRQLTDHASAGWATWHPDGRQVAYWAADETGAGNLWLVDVTGGAPRQLTHHTMIAWPQWSPDGAWIAYQARDEGGWSIRLLDVSSGVERELVRAHEVLPSRPLWSPDGGEILYQSLNGARFELTRWVFARGADGRPDYASPPRHVVVTMEFPIDLGAATQHPAWSPSGTSIAFQMYDLDVIPRAGLVLSYKTWVASPDGARPVLRSPEATLADRSPTWRPDGSWLALWSWDGTYHAGVWLVDPATGDSLELTKGLGGDALYPAWSPDGSRIAFAGNREGTFDIWVADVAVVAPEVLAGGGVRAGP